MIDLRNNMWKKLGALVLWFTSHCFVLWKHPRYSTRWRRTFQLSDEVGIQAPLEAPCIAGIARHEYIFGNEVRIQNILCFKGGSSDLPRNLKPCREM